MNLLMLSSDPSPSQKSGTIFEKTLGELSKHFSQITVISPQRNRNKYNHKIFRNVFFLIGLPPSVHFFYLLFKVPRLVKSKKINAIISHDFFPPYNSLTCIILKTFFNFKGLIISDIHHIDGIPKSADLFESISRSLMLSYFQLLNKLNFQFRVVNKFYFKILKYKLGILNVNIFYTSFIDFETFIYNDEKKIYDIIYIGRLSANKGIRLLYHIFDELDKYNKQFNILIIGRGKLKKLLLHVNKKTKHLNFKFIEWVSSRSEIAKLIRLSKLMIIPSFSEGGPRILLEALSQGTIVISTPVGLSKELQTPLLYVSNFDKTEFCTNIIKIISNYYDTNFQKQIKIETLRLREKIHSVEKTVGSFAAWIRGFS